MDLSCLKVLVVDDQSTMRSILRQYLKKVGITEVCEAENGVEALNKLKCNTNRSAYFDFIICDLHMDEMDGMEFVRKVRCCKTCHNGNKDIPIIILTGDSEILLEEVSMQIGAVNARAILTH